MNAFDTAAVLIAIAALTGYINHRVLKLSATTGTLAVALVSSFVVVAADAVVPGWRLREVLTGFLGEQGFVLRSWQRNGVGISHTLRSGAELSEPPAR